MLSLDGCGLFTGISERRWRSPGPTDGFLVNCFVSAVFAVCLHFSLRQAWVLKISVLVMLLSSKHKTFSALLSGHRVSTNNLTLYPNSKYMGYTCLYNVWIEFICSGFSLYPLVCHDFFTMAKASELGLKVIKLNSKAHHLGSDPESAQSKIFSMLTQTLHFVLQQWTAAVTKALCSPLSF